jgi:TRAP-type C4-dicarboxylate transport system permease small subunit
MLSKTFERRFRRCRNIEQSIGEASPDGLQKIQEKLNDEILASTGIFTFTFPLVFSTFFMILSFALAQFSLWNAVTSYLKLPSTMMMVLLVISSVVYALLYVIVLIVMSKGYMTAVHVHLWVVA